MSSNWDVVPSPSNVVRGRSKTLSLEGTHSYFWLDDASAGTEQRQLQVEWDTKDNVFEVQNELPYPG